MPSDQTEAQEVVPATDLDQAPPANENVSLYYFFLI